MNLTELESKTKDELNDVAKDLGISGIGTLRKQDLVFRIMQAKAEGRRCLVGRAKRERPSR